MDWLTKEEHNNLISNARTIDALLKWEPEKVYVRSEGSIMGKACCCSTLLYDFENEGDSFTVCLTKYENKRHIKSNRHIQKEIYGDEATRRRIEI